MSAPFRIAGISDVSIGYGSPQIPAFMQSLQRHYGNPETFLLEPDQRDRPVSHSAFPSLRVERLAGMLDPHTLSGRIEYNLAAARLVRRLRPRILVVFCSYSLPALFKLRRRPPYVIYYETELAAEYGPLDARMNGHLDSRVDLLIFPEENRVLRDLEKCGYKDLPTLVLYNCPNTREGGTVLPPEGRNGRLIYQGLIEEGRTFAEYFLHPRLQQIPIDLYGWIRDPKRLSTVIRLSKLLGSVRYRGLLDNRSLARVRREYAFSVIAWNPTNDNSLYACPNKFFESISDGVPPLVAPHPQAKMLVEKYDCGLVMEDWSFRSFQEVFREALAIYGTRRYAELVENCLRAAREELNWEAQFAKVAPCLPEGLSR